MPEPKSPYKRVRRAFSQAALKRVCEMHELDFAEAYDMETWRVDVKTDDNFYFFKDNGANILAVAHLDTVQPHERRTASFVNTSAAGPVVFSGALDDRLGAYTILELLPKLGIKYDLLLTVGEESGQSTAQYFSAPKEYNWMIEFDRGGSDVVMYQYDNSETRGLVRKCGATPAEGIFSDISYMEHLEIKGFNWGVGYKDYHGPRSHAFLEDYWTMIGHYLKFHDANAETYLPHEQAPARSYGSYGGGSYGGLWSGGGDYDWSAQHTRYKSLSGEAWWDSEEATDESDHWTDEQWDAFTDGGIDAVRDLEILDEVDIVLEDEPNDDEMVSEDFREVNESLLAESATE